jgi:hypothetical protein
VPLRWIDRWCGLKAAPGTLVLSHWPEIELAEMELKEWERQQGLMIAEDDSLSRKFQRHCLRVCSGPEKFAYSL